MVTEKLRQPGFTFLAIILLLLLFVGFVGFYTKTLPLTIIIIFRSVEEKQGFMEFSNEEREGKQKRNLLV